MDMEKLIEMSRRYGRDDQYVLAGGGNTSYKEGGIMAVKASGSQLADITAKNFVLMQTEALRALPEHQYPEGDDQREAAAIRDMNDARLPDQQEKRPSVECILHALFPRAYVLHLHPALVNGMTCGKEGAAAAEALFPEAVWIPLTKPGLILSQVCARAFSAAEKKTGRPVDCVFLQNHGLFVAGDTVAEIDEKMEAIMETLMAKITCHPTSAGGQGKKSSPPPTGAGRIPGEDLDRISALDPEGGTAFAIQSRDGDILAFAESEEAMAPLRKPFSPDHIVYCKPAPLYVKNLDDIQTDYDAFRRDQGYNPKIIVVKGAGAIGLGASEKEAATAMALFQDAVRVAVYSRSFGGPLQLPDEFTRFITNWEIESYRAKKSLGGS